MSGVLPFALAGRWIVTVESVREFVKVRHRTRWYAVARRQGHEDRRHRCASRADALAIAEIVREGEREREARERDPRFQWFQARYQQMTEAERLELERSLGLSDE